MSILLYGRSQDEEEGEDQHEIKGHDGLRNQAEGTGTSLDSI